MPRDDAGGDVPARAHTLPQNAAIGPLIVWQPSPTYVKPVRDLRHDVSRAGGL